MRTAIITGAKGQDASYLAELLLEKEYQVVALERSSTNPNYCNIKHLFDNPNYILQHGDISDFGGLCRIVRKYKPDEFYNLAAQSFVGSSWDQPKVTCEANYMGVVNCLEALRSESTATKFIQASTSEVYGRVSTDVQNEDTPANPQSPYGASKYAAESIIKVYRASYPMFCCFTRAFNHESPRRGRQFVTRKITSAIGEMSRKINEHFDELFEGSGGVSNAIAFRRALDTNVISPLELGNLDARRDWCHSKDIVRGMWLAMQQESPDDYVLASGRCHSVRDFVGYAFEAVGIKDWEYFVKVNPKLYRPADVNLLCGDYSKAKKNLGWEPEIGLDALIKEMVQSDMYGE